MAFTLKKYYANTPCTFVGTGDIVYIPDDVEVTELEPTTGAIMMALNGEGSLLPPGYTRLAYLEATGTQYIDTGLALTNLDKVRIDRQLTAERGYAGGLFGVDDGSSNMFGWGEYPDRANYQAWIFFGTRTGAVWGVPPRSNRYVLEFGESAVTALGVKITSISRQEPFDSSPMTCYYFWRNRLTSVAKYIGRVFEFEIVGRCHHIPAMSSNGVPCMVDIVTKQPFFNAGDGAFIAGIETLAQLYSLLAKLPDKTGQEQGALTIRLDAALQTDELRALIDARAEAKNWEITEAA